MKILRSTVALTGAALFVAATLMTQSGCDTKEKVIDIETPAGEVEVERDEETGDTDVEVNTDE